MKEQRTKKWRMSLTVASMAAIGVLMAGCGAGASPSSSGEGQAELKPLRINQAVETLLYLPLYVAADQGLFEKQGLDLKLTTAGTGAGAWSSVLGGTDDFSIHDPVYVPISRESGGDGIVVGTVYDAVGIWVVGQPDTDLQDDPSGFNGSSVVTMPEPDSTWAFFNYMVDAKGLDRASIDQQIVNPGNELAPVLSGRADYALAIEPNASQGLAEGLHLNYSFSADPDWYPFAFSSVVSTRKFVEANPDVVAGLRAAMNEAFEIIQKDPDLAVEIAQRKFSDLDPQIVKDAVTRAIESKGFPEDVEVTQAAWDNTMRMAAFVNNVKAHPSDITSYEENVLPGDE